MYENYVTVRVRGEMEFVDRCLLARIFETKPVMNNLYPGETRDILEVFCLPKGTGEIFDLSVALRN